MSSGSDLVVEADERQPLLSPVPPPRASSSLLSEPNSEATEEAETDMGLREWLEDINVIVYLLVMTFAIASWIDINGVWVELPLLVEVLPEGWDLPSYLVMIIQIANVGPIAYTLASHFCSQRVKEWPVVYLIIAIGTVSCLLMSFFWDKTTFINGKEHSTPLLTLTAFLALVDCTSSVVFLPYMASFKPQYLTAFYVGEGLSGLIPGIVGLIQGVGSDPQCLNRSEIIYNETTGENSTIWEVVPVYKPPLFSVDVFFLILFLLLCCSGLAFTALNFLPYCKKERLYNNEYIIPARVVNYQKSSNESSSGAYSEKPNPDAEESGRSNSQVEEPSRDLELSTAQNILHVNPPDNSDEKDSATEGLGFWQYAFLLGVISWVNGLTNGVLPSTQSYSSLPYSNMAYTLSVRLSTVANPLACFMALFISTQSFVAVMLLTLAGTILSGYQLYLAALSPYPILQDEVIGEVLCILTQVLLTGIFSYVKVAVAAIFQRQGKKALLWCGIFTQVGSCIGAIIIFILINVVKVFTASYADPCPVNM